MTYEINYKKFDDFNLAADEMISCAKDSFDYAVYKVTTGANSFKLFVLSGSQGVADMWLNNMYASYDAERCPIDDATLRKVFYHLGITLGWKSCTTQLPDSEEQFIILSDECALLSLRMGYCVGDKSFMFLSDALIYESSCQGQSIQAATLYEAFTGYSLYRILVISGDSNKAMRLATYLGNMNNYVLGMPISAVSLAEKKLDEETRDKLIAAYLPKRGIHYIEGYYIIDDVAEV